MQLNDKTLPERAHRAFHYNRALFHNPVKYTQEHDYACKIPDSNVNSSNSSMVVIFSHRIGERQAATSLGQTGVWGRRYSSSSAHRPGKHLSSRPKPSFGKAASSTDCKPSFELVHMHAGPIPSSASLTHAKPKKHAIKLD